MKDGSSNPAGDLVADQAQDVIVALRSAQQHQVQLTVLADQKANINIGFTLFLITLNLEQIFDAIGEGGWIRVGAVLLFLAIASSLLLALFVVLPRIGKRRIERPEQMTNPFFFGMFSQLPQKVYVDYLVGELRDNASARRMLAEDIYQIGTVLRRKYRLLRLSYAFLATGVALAVILFCMKILLA